MILNVVAGVFIKLLGGIIFAFLLLSSAKVLILILFTDIKAVSLQENNADNAIKIIKNINCLVETIKMDQRWQKKI